MPAPPPGGSYRAPRHTLVAFNAHPDDESLLTGGTLARAARDGHRVVLVVATSGERGLAGREDHRGSSLGEVRVRELQAAATILGAARVVSLGFGDSGLHPDPGDTGAFVHVDVDVAATRLVEVLEEEHAEVLVICDRNGGYGHPDHVQAHRVGTRAATVAGTPVVLEATVPGRLFRAVLTALRTVGDALGTAPLPTRDVFAAPGSITHRVRVTTTLSAKRAAMGAHASQTRGSGGTRALTRFLRLPLPLFALVFGHEWFVEHGRRPGSLQGDIFASLREAGTSRPGSPRR